MLNHKVKREEDCAKLSLANQISGTDFEFLNPSVGSQCSNLEVDFAYCVAPVGDISLYPGYHPTSTTSFTHTPRPTSTSTEDVYIPTYSPLAPGTLDNCYYYSQAVTKGVNLDYTNSCAVSAAVHRVKVSDLKEWNPSLTDQDCTLKPGYRYCVQKVEVPGKLFLSYLLSQYSSRCCLTDLCLLRETLHCVVVLHVRCDTRYDHAKNRPDLQLFWLCRQLHPRLQVK